MQDEDALRLDGDVSMVGGMVNRVSSVRRSAGSYIYPSTLNSDVGSVEAIT